MDEGGDLNERKLVDVQGVKFGKRKVHLMEATTGSNAEGRGRGATPQRPMSLQCLNCQELGEPLAGKNLRNLLRRTKLSLVFLSETKLSIRK